MTRRPSTESRVALAVVLAAGLALVVTCPRKPARDAARSSLRELDLELGRQRLLAGDAERALPYLGAAYDGAEDDAGLRFLVARAVEALTREAPVSPDGAGDLIAPRTVRLRRDSPESRTPFSSADLDGEWARVAALDSGGEPAIFDARDGRLLHRLAGAPAAVSVRFSPDGERVAGLHAAGRFSLWESATGELLLTSALPLSQALETTVLRAAGPAAGGAAGLAMDFSADGSRLATLASDGVARLWDTADGRCVESFETGAVTAAALDAGARRLVTAGETFATIWNLETAKKIVTLDLPRNAALESLAYSPDGRRIAAAGRPPEVRLFDAATGEIVAFLAGSAGTVHVAAFSPDGALLVTAGDDGAARIWDAGRGRLVGVLPLAGSDVIHAEYGPRSAGIATIYADGTLGVQAVPLDERGAAEVDRLRKCLVPWRLSSGPLGGDPAAGDPAGARGRLVPATPDPAACGRIRPASRIRRQTVPRPEPEARNGPPVKRELLPIRLETAVILRVVDLAGKPVPGAEVRLWAEGTPLVTLPHDGPLASAAFSADGRRVMTVADDGGAMVWDLETRRPLSEIVPGEAPRAAAFSVSPDGKAVATISEDVIGIWEAGTGRRLGEPLRHDGAVRTVAFSPDGRSILTASQDGAARLWQAPGSSDAESMQALLRPLTVTDAAGQVRFEIARTGPRQNLSVSRSGYRSPEALLLPSRWESLSLVAELSDGEPPSRIHLDAESTASPYPPTYVVLRDANLVETIRSWSWLAGWDVVMSPEVRGTISAEIPGYGEEGPFFRETFERILAACGLTSEQSGPVTLVYAAGRTLPSESEVVKGGRLPDGGPISLSLNDADLQETLRRFGSKGAAGLLIDPDVSGLVSVELRWAPWNLALVAILRVSDLELEVSGKYWRIRRRVARGEP